MSHTDRYHTVKPVRITIVHHTCQTLVGFPTLKKLHRIADGSRVVFKRNSSLVASAENVKIQYLFDKIFNSYVYILVDNDTMKNLKEI